MSVRINAEISALDGKEKSLNHSIYSQSENDEGVEEQKEHERRSSTNSRRSIFTNIASWVGLGAGRKGWYYYDPKSGRKIRFSELANDAIEFQY